MTDKIMIYKTIKFVLANIALFAGFYFVFTRKFYRLGFEIIKK